MSPKILSNFYADNDLHHSVWNVIDSRPKKRKSPGSPDQGSQHFMKKKFPEFSLRKFQENYFPFNEVARKSRSGSSTANCYCLERCVIFTKPL